MLRSVEGTDYWWGKGWSLFATYSNAPVHQNADKLSIMLYGNSHHWLVDCEARAGVYHAFSSAVQRELNRETVCHNTLLVDGVGQRHPDRRLDLVEYAMLPDAKRLTIGDLDGRLYQDVRQLRTVIVRDEYVLDVFQVEAPEEHDYAWLTHIDGLPSDGSVTEWLPTDLPDAPPWKWLRDPRKADVAGAYWETFTHDEERFRIDAVSDGPVEVVQCGFPRDDGPSPETYAMRMLRCKRPSARFVALYHLGADADSPAEIAMTVTEMGRFEVVIQLAGRDWRHLVPDLKSLR